MSRPSSSSSEPGYQSFVVSHTNAIEAVESSIRSLTWFLPWFRFREADLASESLTALLNLTSLYHDVLIRRKLARARATGAAQALSNDHSRYTAAWISTNPTYKRAAHLLEIIRYLQLVIEMVLRRQSSRLAWRGILTLEILKTILRLTLLRVTGRPLVHPHLPERDPDPTAFSEPNRATKPSEFPQKPLQTPDHIKNNHSFFPPSPASVANPLLSTVPNRPSSVDDFLLAKALSPASVCPPTQLVALLITPRDWMAEIIYIVRPLLYVIMISSTSRRRGHRPFVLSLGFEILSLLLRRPAPPNLHVERHEYARRDRDLLWYLLRGPIWEQYSKPKILAVVQSTQSIPLLGILTALLRDWVPLIDRYHYYTSS